MRLGADRADDNDGNTMKVSEIENELEALLREELSVDVAEIDSSSRLIDDLGLDSVAFAISIVAIEDRLGVRVSERELLECTTLGDIAAAVHRRRPAAARAK